MADPHNPVEENQFNLIHETDDDNDDVDTEETGSETEEEESGEQEYTPIVNSPRVSGNSDGDSVEECRSKRRRLEETSIGDEIAERFQGKEWNRTEIEGLFCSICMDAWANEGDHHICCLPCGHIYGLSCISKWLRRTNSAKCPQCNAKCSVKDVRKLFAPRIAAVDNESQKIIRSLEVKCAELQKNEAELKLKVKLLLKDSVSTKEAMPALEKLENSLVGLDLSFLTGLDTFNSSMIPSGEAFTSSIGAVPSREACTSSNSGTMMPCCDSVMLAKKTVSECLGLEVNSVSYIKISRLKSAISVLSSSYQSVESQELLSSLATKVSDYCDNFHSWINEFVDVSNRVRAHMKDAHEFLCIENETEARVLADEAEREAYQTKQKTIQDLEQQIAKCRAEMEEIEQKRAQFRVEQIRAVEQLRIRCARLQSQRDEFSVWSNRMNELCSQTMSIMTAWCDLRSIDLSSLDLDF